MSGQFNNYGPAGEEEEVHNVVPYRMALSMYHDLSKYMYLVLLVFLCQRAFFIKLSELATLIPAPGFASALAFSIDIYRVFHPFQ